MTMRLSNLYDVRTENIRGKAAEGFIRPTLSQYFMSYNAFVEVPSNPLLDPETGGFLDVTGGNVNAQGDCFYVTSVNTLTSGKYYIEHNATNVSYKVSIRLQILDATDDSLLVQSWGFNYPSYTTNYNISGGEVIGYRLDIDNKTVDVYADDGFKKTYNWNGGDDGIKLKVGVEVHGVITPTYISAQLIPGPDFTYEIPSGYRYLNYG